MLHYLKQYKLRVFLLCSGITIRQLLLVSGAAINANVLNALVGQNLRLFGIQFVYLAIVWALIIFLDIWIQNYQMNLIQDLSILTRDELSSSLANSDFEEFHSKSNGTYVSWLNNDIQTINRQGYTQLFDIVHGISGSIFSVILLVSYHWSLLLVTMIGTLMMLSIPRIFNRRVREANLNTTVQNEQFLSEVEDAISGYDTLFALNYLMEMPRRIYLASKDLKKVRLEQTSIEAKVSAVGFSLNVFLQMAVIGLTGYLALIGAVEIGAIEATGMLATLIFTSLSSLSNQLSAINGVAPIFEKFNSNIDRTEENQIDYNETTFNTPTVFEAQNLTFTYGNKTIIDNISFNFDENHKYLIIGDSGSGKSTLLRLLSGFLTRYSGHLTFFGNEMKSLNKESIRNQVLYIDQNPYLFSDTIRNNIILNDQYTDEEIISSLEFAGLKPDNPTTWLDKEVGDNGRFLSGGERQRIALIRGLIRQRNILLIDEGTSAVDKETSIEIERQLLQNPDLTIVLITHSPNQETLEYFDKIYSFPKDFKL